MEPELTLSVPAPFNITVQIGSTNRNLSGEFYYLLVGVPALYAGCGVLHMIMPSVL